MKNHLEILLTNFLPYKKELPNKISEQIAFNNRSKIEEHMLVAMDKSFHEEHLAQPLQTNKQYKTAVTFLTGYNGTFNVTNSNKNFPSGKQTPTEMLLFKLLYHQVPMEVKI